VRPPKVQWPDFLPFPISDWYQMVGFNVSISRRSEATLVFACCRSSKLP